jgi:hypothetical protein
MYAVFENPGILDLNAILKFGVNAKPNTESPIGFFGTGLKYALAIAGRFHLPVTIQTGTGVSYDLGVRPMFFRTTEFNELTLSNNDGGLALPFTTELGKNWELWQAFRELESNVRDEGGKSYQSTHVLPPEPGTVRFFVGGEMGQRYPQLLKETFFDPRGSIPAYAGGSVRLEPSRHLFFRGIKVFTLPEDKCFDMTYNIGTVVNLSEDRLIKSHYEMTSAIGALIANIQDAVVARRFLVASEKAFEHEIQVPIYLWKETFTDEAEAVYGNPRLMLRMNKFVQRELDDKQRETKRFAPHNLDSVDEEMLREATVHLKRWGYFVPSDIVVSDEMPDNILGCVRHDTIYISTRCFGEGLECLCATLIEEILHQRYSYDDYTRSMQDRLLRDLVRIGMRLSARSGT